LKLIQTVWEKRKDKDNIKISLNSTRNEKEKVTTYIKKTNLFYATFHCKLQSC